MVSAIVEKGGDREGLVGGYFGKHLVESANNCYPALDGTEKAMAGSRLRARFALATTFLIAERDGHRDGKGL